MHIFYQWSADEIVIQILLWEVINLSKKSKERKEIRKSVNEARRGYTHHIGMYKRDTKILEQLANPIYHSGFCGFVPKIISKDTLITEQKESIASAKKFLKEWELQSRKDIEVSTNLKQQKQAIKRHPMNDLFLQIQEIEDALTNPDPGAIARDPLIEAGQQVGLHLL